MSVRIRIIQGQNGKSHVHENYSYTCVKFPKKTER